MEWNEPYQKQSVTTIHTDGQTNIPMTQGYKPGSGDIQVFLNGMLQIKDDDYTESSAYSIEFAFPLMKGDVVTITVLKFW